MRVGAYARIWFNNPDIHEHIYDDTLHLTNLALKNGYLETEELTIIEGYQNDYYIF